MFNMRLRSQDLIRHGRTLENMYYRTLLPAARDTFSKEEGMAGA